MAGQMCWLSQSNTDGEKILHLRLHPYQPWVPYTAMSLYTVPDAAIPGASIELSRGWSTFLRLSKAGWVLIATADAYSSSQLAS